jgi:hypothetical protein
LVRSRWIEVAHAANAKRYWPNILLASWAICRHDNSPV